MIDSRYCVVALVSARMFYIIKDGGRAWIIKIHHSGAARDFGRDW